MPSHEPSLTGCHEEAEIAGSDQFIQAAVVRASSLNMSCEDAKNTGRIDLLPQPVEDFQVDGVVDLTWQACHTCNMESRVVRQLVEDRYGLSFLWMETDYSESDTERLRGRIEAFPELVH